MPITGSRLVVSESHAAGAWARRRISPSRRPVVDEREDLAGHRYPGLVGAASLGDAPKPGSQGRSAVIAGHRLDQRPPHQLRAL
jgi:hypothetical protein